jgi:branched-chain amino acid transport system substrate-binding protein
LTRSLGSFLIALLLSACAEAPPPVIAGAATGSFLNAMRLALADAEADGRLARVDTVLIPEASSRSAPALDVAQRLVGVPGLVAVVGHSNSVGSLATSQVYNLHRVVQIAPTSTAALYSEAGPFSFRMVPPDHAQGAFLAQLIADSLAAERQVALLFVNDDYGRGLRRAVLDRMDVERNPVVLDLPHTEGDVQPVDVEHTLEAIQASGADAILWLGRVPALDALLPGLRDRMGPIPVFGGDAVSRGDLVQAFHPAWEGVYFVDFVDMDATPELRDFRRRYRERYVTTTGEGAPGGPEVLSYDAAGVILAAVESGARTGEEVREYLMSLGRSRPPFPGLGGPVSFDDSGDLNRSYVLRRFGEGEGR